MAPSSSAGPQSHQIFCCAFNANGTVFVTGSSDTLARVHLMNNSLVILLASASHSHALHSPW